MGLTSAFAGAVAAGVLEGLASSFLAGSAAKAVTANADAIKVAINFMIFPFRLYTIFTVYNNNALAHKEVDMIW